MAKHHLDDATLIRYASGDLDEAFSVVVAAHIAMCDDCRRAVRAAEEVGGQLLDEGDEAELSHGALERLSHRLELDELNENGTAGAAIRCAERDEGDVPAPLRRLIGSSLDSIPWMRVAPGIRKHSIELPTESGSSLYMLKIAPNKTVPEHGHGGAELTLVLSGAYRDELGRFEPGDVADLDEHLEHQPRVDSDEACICIVATEAPTRFKGLISRVLQPLVRI